eukprot:TRINITY_DN9367_c0_g2_i2.p2 TRINITY_DN9367_c0_g2~~TRINITY_DN9367_c0_g2_i2.p2  ORF type:complete len:151 (+),score=20.82 TRINITY_DN9367_c0_g2_i2:76-528(+)
MCIRDSSTSIPNADEFAKKYETFYLNKVLNKDTKKPTHHLRTKTMKERSKEGESEIIKKIYEVYGENPSLNDILSVMKKAKHSAKNVEEVKKHSKHNSTQNLKRPQRNSESNRSIQKYFNSIHNRGNDSFGNVNRPMKTAKQASNVQLSE